MHAPPVHYSIKRIGEKEKEKTFPTIYIVYSNIYSSCMSTHMSTYIVGSSIVWLKQILFPTQKVQESYKRENEGDRDRARSERIKCILPRPYRYS